MIKKLIGAQIVNVGDDYIEVKKDGQIYKLEIIGDYGSCCGFAYFDTYLLYSPEDERNPIITDIVLEDTTYDGGESSVITFYGESKPLAKIESEVGSGSGWNYGACVTIRCKPLGIYETLASW